MIETLTTRIESWLRIDPDGAKSHVMRARAVYLIGGAFILTQVINMFAMHHSYEGFTLDHLISAIACVLVLGTISMMRVHQVFWIYAFIFSALIIAATFASALPERTGINSALLPFFVLGIIMNGFVSGLRSTLMFSVFAMASVWFLYWISMTYTATPIFDVEKFADRNFQRAVQTSLAVVMITLVAGVFAHHMHAAFAELETEVEVAESSDRDKTLFLTTMSHELTTPLNGIISLSDVLAETELDTDQREMVELINTSGGTLQAIVRNVLTFSQIEQDRIAIDSAPFDPARTLISISGAHRAQAVAKGVGFDVQLSSELPPRVLGDAARLSQIVGEVLCNAVKFTPAGGSVQMSVLCRRLLQTERETASLVIAVRDSGVGITEAQLTRIYDRFSQGDGSITREFGGTGLGLTVAQGLAQAMGAQLAAQSRVGSGSIFTLSLELPIADAEAEPEDALPSLVDAPSLSPSLRPATVRAVRKPRSPAAA